MGSLKDVAARQLLDHHLTWPTVAGQTVDLLQDPEVWSPPAEVKEPPAAPSWVWLDIHHAAHFTWRGVRLVSLKHRPFHVYEVAMNERLCSAA